MSNITVRLVGKGWTGFTGSMGSVPFEDGLSTRDCTQREIDQLAAITRIETVEGDALGIATRLKGGATLPAPVVAPLARQSEKAKVVETHTPANAGGPAPELHRYTVEELHKAADDKGLAGLRDIATPRGLKGRSINDLVEAILKDQEARLGKAPETAAPAPETPAPDAPAPEAPDTPAENAEPETPAIDGEHDANAQAAAALSQSQDA